MDPDQFALAIVQQYLTEHGYNKALRALEAESGVKFVDEKLRQGSQLLQMVYDRIESQLSASLGEGQGRLQQLEDTLLKGGDDDYPRHLAATVSGLFPANVICLACWPGQYRAVAGLGDGSIRVFSYGGEALGAAAISSSGVLCVAIRPSSSRTAGTVVAAGCMDGSICLVDTAPATLLPCASAQPHRKYAVTLKWSPDGRFLVTGSWDHSFAVLEVVEDTASSAAPAGSGPSTAAAVATGMQEATEGEGAHDPPPTQHHATPPGGLRLCVVHQEQCSAQVNDVEFLPGMGGRAFLVAVRGSNHLHQYQIQEDSGGGAAGVVEGGRHNMNSVGDDYVSFSAAHLAMAPGADHLLLVSADNGRLILFDLEGWTQVRNFYGLPTEQFHQFAAVWQASGHYIMAAAAAGMVYVFHVGSAKVAEKLRAHDKNVRNLTYDGASNLLLTCSFDRSVKVFER